MKIKEVESKQRDPLLFIVNKTKYNGGIVEAQQVELHGENECHVSR
jgi:hypothetical protein